ncbi:MAG: acetylxylan esterase [Planctomycetota bacterium]|jgi:cephalosporin-C deacetylase-like acetyl esterase
MNDVVRTLNVIEQTDVVEVCQKYSRDIISRTQKAGCIAALILALCSCRTHPEQFHLSIDEGWVMKTGDNRVWAESEFDDGSWKSVKIGSAWEEAGFAEYDGYAWYRVRFVIPKGWNQEKAMQENWDNDFLVLSLGPIDDADVTYFNGVKIGTTGTMPPEYASAYGVERRYRIPIDKVNWGQPNVIAVRVYDHEGPGGIYKGPVFVRLPRIDDLINLSFHLGNSKGIYSLPGALPVTMKISNHSNKKCSLILECTLKNDRVVDDSVIERIRTDVHVDQNSDAYQAMSFDPPGPGFYKVTCMLSDGRNNPFAKSMVFGYGPEKIETELTREDDFEDFWSKRRLELEKVEPSFEVTGSDRSTEDVDVYLVKMRSHGNVRIRGWYTVPKKPGPHAAILSVPGYNSTMRPYVNRKNVATFALNPRGHGNSKDDVDAKGGEYMYLGFDPEHPEKYVYVGAYMDCVRAVDFLTTRPEIDKSRIGVEGASQGGGLSFATAALDRRIAFCAPDIPWLGDWVGYLEASDWPNDHYPELIERFPGLTFGDINRVLSYVDTMNLADRIRCPVLMSVGLQDSVCPPRNSFATYNRVRSQKEYRVYPLSGHKVDYRHNHIKNEWIAAIVGVKKL